MIPPRRILICSDKWKGSLTASEACAALAEGVGRVWPDTVCDEVPMADGGEGTLEAVEASVGGDWISMEVTGPLGEKVRARYLMVRRLDGKREAVLEMSQAAGLHLVPEEKRRPRHLTSRGVGEMMRHALEQGADQLMIGLGGSATNDGGAGLAAALGYRFFDKEGRALEPVPDNFPQLDKVQAPPNLNLPPVVAACDVRNPLLGEHGASHAFGPQKGASPDEVEFLDAALKKLADRVEAALEASFRDRDGAGAAGGLGFGLFAFAGASMETGFEWIAGLADLKTLAGKADLIFTGEGKMDRFSMEGKAPGGVSALARSLGCPVVGFAGLIEDAEILERHFDALAPVIDRAMSLDEAVAGGAGLVGNAAARVCRLLQLGADHAKLSGHE